MIRIATIFCLLAVYAHGNTLPSNPRLLLNGDELIVGGHPIEITEAPYQVSFQRQGSHMCGGSIISDYHVLTAGHCGVVESDARYLTVGSGASKLSKLQKHRVVRNSVHSLYNKYTIDYDVAVLKVATPFAVSASRKPIAFVNIGEQPADEEAVMVSGWGTTTSGGDVSSTLMAVDVNVINLGVCEEAYSSKAEITPRMVCAGRLSGGKDSCQGDSGGPLVSKVSGKQVGIVSWGYGCAEPNYPGVYTNLADKEINDFVTSHMKN